MVSFGIGVSLVAAKGIPKEDIALGLLHFICNKTYSLVGRIDVENIVFFLQGF